MPPAPARPAGADVPVDGVLVIDKPEGPTSHTVVAAARRILGVRQVGHTGTLDPMATGVLALVVGRATRLAQFLSGREKEYVARIRLGVATDTFDRTGAVVRSVEPGCELPDVEAVTEALRAHLGEQAQVPPVFSAKKVDGVRAYRLARKGQAAEMAAATVTLHSASIEAFDPPFVDVRLTCSSGFYVRSLADSLGERLGCGACLEALRRTASGRFTLAQAIPLRYLQESPDAAFERLVPLEQALPDVPAVRLTEDGVRRALHGNDVGPGDWIEVRPGSIRLKPDATYDEPRGSDSGAWNPAFAGFGSARVPYVQLLSPDGRLLAIARRTGPGVLHPAVVLG